MVHVWPALKIIVRRWFWTSKDVYWGAIVFFQIRRSWKSWGSQIFFCEKYWVSTWNKQDIIGWLQYFTEFVFNMTTPMQIINATLNGLHYWFMITLQFRGGSYNFWLSNTGVTKYCRGTFGNLWTPIPKYGDLIIHLFMCFLINQILRNIKWFQRNLI